MTRVTPHARNQGFAAGHNKWTHNMDRSTVV